VHDDFLDLVFGDPIVEGGGEMHLEFVGTIERDERRYRNQAASMSREVWAGPDLSPRVTSDEVLELGVEFRLGCLGTIDMRVAKDRPPYAEAFVSNVLRHSFGDFLCQEVEHRRVEKFVRFDV
jgi:hypothetical protein